MKIAPCRSRSTGKTTLLRACKDKWQNVTFIEEVTRDVIAAGMTNVISDRCILDVLAYMYANRSSAIPEWFERIVEELANGKLVALTGHAISRLNLILHLMACAQETASIDCLLTGSTTGYLRNMELILLLSEEPILISSPLSAA